MQLFKETHIDFMKYRKVMYLLSSSVAVIGMIIFFMRGSANFGIDFRGGTLVSYKFPQVINVGDVRNALRESGLSESIIQSSNEGKGIIIRTSGDQRKEIEEIINKKFASSNPIIEQEITIGPVAGKLLQKQALLAVTFALIGILVYTAFRFKFIWGFSAVLMLFHDTLFMVGMFAITKREISLSVIAAILTVLGYSINDTIVVFDRIRENLKGSASRGKPLAEVINSSINQMLSRTILTSFTTIITVFALLIWGGPVLKDFAFALALGIIEGTYSSIYIAAPLIIELSKGFKIKPTF